MKVTVKITVSDLEFPIVNRNSSRQNANNLLAP